MSKNKNAQYQQNIDIVKGFFRKPIVLIVGILTIVASLFQSLADYFMASSIENTLSTILNGLFTELQMFGDNTVAVGVEVDAGFSLDIFAIAMGIAFILLFAHGRSSKNYIRGSAKYFKVLATIEYVLAFILAVCCVLMAIMVFFISIPTYAKYLLACVFLIVGAYVFICNFNKLRFAKSICNSMDSIYLEKKGATAFAVLSFINSAFSFAVFDFLLFTYSDNVGFYLYPIAYAFKTALFLILGIFALTYSRYIEGIKKGTVPMPVKAEAKEPVKQVENICSNCGTAFTDEDIFCHVCGNKLR